MKKSMLFSLTGSETVGGTLLQKMFMALLLIALVLASFPAPRAFAASGDAQDQACRQSGAGRLRMSAPKVFSMTAFVYIQPILRILIIWRGRMIF